MSRKPITYLYFPVLFFISLWLVKLIEFGFDLHLQEFGIYPRSYADLPKIITAPFIHGDFNHLISNSIPLFFLSTAIFYFYPRLAFKIIIYTWLLTGFGVWLGGRFAWHIGASGLVYAFASFLFFAGVVSKNRRLMAISLLVIFLYGGMIWGIFPNDPHVSWEAHLFGFLSGIVLTFYYTPEIKFVDSPKQNQVSDDFTDFSTSWGDVNFKYTEKKEDPRNN
ncbi:MAG: rhomboid family intramembrane serine protease [Bacteroidetes bacterium]|nr:MAG: rhomboid family intramembrane serine protease [Bacteroidota bacterium]